MKSLTPILLAVGLLLTPPESKSLNYKDTYLFAENYITSLDGVHMKEYYRDQGLNMYVHDFDITVQEGDNLSKIAKKINGLNRQSLHPFARVVKWQDIFNRNQDKIKNPDIIKPGQKLSYNMGNPGRTMKFSD